MPVFFSSSKGWPCVLSLLTLAHSECQLICWTVIFILLALWLSNCKWRGSYKQWEVKWPSVSQWHGVFGYLMSHFFWRRYERETQPTYCWISPHTDFCEVNYLKGLFLVILATRLQNSFSGVQWVIRKWRQWGTYSNFLLREFLRAYKLHLP